MKPSSTFDSIDEMRQKRISELKNAYRKKFQAGECTCHEAEELMRLQ
jgi:hypothetical protein